MNQPTLGAPNLRPIPIQWAVGLTNRWDSLMRTWRTDVLKKPRPHDAWIADRGDQTLRLDYDLTAESVVLDVGGFMGNWSAAIEARYHPSVHIFEPVSQYREQIKQRFLMFPKVTVHSYGLAEQSSWTEIAVEGDASSVTRKTRAQTETIELRDVAEVLGPVAERGIDLIKINIEGGEYGLLARMLETGLAARCRDIQVQFHPWIEDAAKRKEELQRRLSATHRLTYEYPFVWENWRRLG
jgi:FkbM family methyltransferase